MRELLIIDLQAITHIGLKTIASQCNLYSSIKDGAGKADISQFLSIHPNGIVVVDYTMVDISEEYLMLLHARFPKANFILFSDTLVTDFVRRIIYSSTSFSILLKDCTRKEAEQGLNDASLMRQFVCKKMVSQIADDDSHKSEMLSSPLTVTEKEILKLMALGKSTKDIASMRFLSVNTVMTHRKNIFRKLSVNNVHEATRYAMRAGLVDPMEYYI